MGKQSLEAYLGRIRQAFPDLAFTTSRLIEKGWDHDVVVLDERVVFRFPKQDPYHTRFKAEVALLDYLRPRLPLPVPHYVYRVPDTAFGGYDMLPGTELVPEIFPRLNADEREHLARQLGGFLSALHATPLPIAKQAGFEQEDGGYWWSRENTERTWRGLKSKIFSKLDRDEVAWIEHQFERYLSLSMDFEITVIQSDFTSDHILVDRDGHTVTGIIDFGDIEFADPALDFAGLWEYGPGFPEMVLAHYTGPAGKDFLERSKFPRLVHMVGNMLEIEEGLHANVSYATCRKQLREVMRSGLTL